MLPILRICALLNAEGAKYLLVGAQAAMLHGHVRATSDVDVLIPEDEANHSKVIRALARLRDGAAAELTPQDFIENVVVKIADEYEVDVSTRAWKVTYVEALPTARQAEIEGVQVQYIGLEKLIESKLTYRQQDAWDVQMLRNLQSLL